MALLVPVATQQRFHTPSSKELPKLEPAMKPSTQLKMWTIVTVLMIWGFFGLVALTFSASSKPDFGTIWFLFFVPILPVAPVLFAITGGMVTYEKRFDLIEAELARLRSPNPNGITRDAPLGSA
jgi:hypothetical protein